MERWIRIVVLFGVACGIVGAVPAAFCAEEEARMDRGIVLYRDGKIAEAEQAFAALAPASPGDTAPRVWMDLCALERARLLKEANDPAWKSLVLDTFGDLKGMAGGARTSADWYFAMAKAFSLNERQMKAQRALQKAFYFRKEFPEARMLDADVFLLECSGRPPTALDYNRGVDSREICGTEARKRYEDVLAIPDLPSGLRAEALFKIGNIHDRLLGAKDNALESWKQASAAGPDTHYGRLAAGMLNENR